MDGPDEGRTVVQVVEGVMDTVSTEGPHEESLGLAPTDAQEAGQTEPNRDKKYQGRKLATKTEANQELAVAFPRHSLDHTDPDGDVSRQSREELEFLTSRTLKCVIAFI